MKPAIAPFTLHFYLLYSPCRMLAYSRTRAALQSISRPASLPFPKVCGSCLTGLPNTPVLRSAWSLPENIGFPSSTSSKVKSRFIPSPEIRQLRDLVRYHSKLTSMLSREKNRAQNCLTVSNLKLDDVFSDVFGKSTQSITQYILGHPGETFDVSPFVDRRCKAPYRGDTGYRRRGSLPRADSRAAPIPCTHQRA